MDEKLLPPGEPFQIPVTPAEPERAPSAVLSGTPSVKQQQWGVVISIVIIVLMIIVGAFYAWGERISQNQVPDVSSLGQ